MTAFEDLLPWKSGGGPYENNGPDKEVEFSIGSATMRVTPTGDTGIHTGRRRYRVECLVCKEVIHENTTGPTPHCREHFEQRHTKRLLGGL